MTETISLVFSLLILSFFLVLPLTIIFLVDRKDKINYQDNYERLVLCLPSGELINMDYKKWSKLKDENKIHWDKKLGYNFMLDKHKTKRFWLW